MPKNPDPNYKDKGSKKRTLPDKPSHIQKIRSITSSAYPGFKSTMMIDEDALKSANKDFDPESFKENLNPHFQNIKEHRPIGKIIKRSATNSPEVIATPEKGTLLTRVAKYGFVSLFTNYPFSIPYEKIKIQKYIDTTSDFFKSSASYQSVKEMLEDLKQQTVVITKEQLEKAEKEREENNHRRRISQNRVMTKQGASAKHAGATAYANATCLFEIKLSWEWLHFCAHEFYGDVTQNDRNLGAGSGHANSDMTFVEPQIKRLAEIYPDGFTLQILSKVIGNPELKTQIPTIIEYNIITPDFVLPFKFNAQNPNRPHINFQQYINEIVDAFINYAKDKNNPQKKARRELTYENSNPFLIFSKSQMEKEEKNTSPSHKNTSPHSKK